MHHEIDEWAATLEDTPQVRSAVVMALKEATLVVLKALDEDRFTAVCSAGPDRTAHMVPLKPGCDASFAAASSAQWPAVPLKKSKDEVLRFLTELRRVFVCFMFWGRMLCCSYFFLCCEPACIGD